MFVKLRMTANPFTVDPDTRVTEAQEIMESKRVRHLPVVDGGRVVGVISRGDLAAAAPSKATTLSAGESRYLLSKLTVARVMSKDPITVTPDALLEEAAVLLRDHKIEMLPVVDGGRLVGVITESAILDAFIEILGFRDHGARFMIEAPDTPGTLSRLSAITGKHGANILHVAVYRGEGNHSTVVLGVNTTNTGQLEADIAAEGFRVLSRRENA